LWVINMSFEGLARWTYRNRRLVILIWLGIILLSVALVPRVSSILAHGATETTRGEAAEGYALLEEDLGLERNAMIVVFTSDTLRTDDPQFAFEMDAALAGLRDIEELDPPMTYASTGDPRFVSTDGHTAYAVVGMNADLFTGCKLVPDVREQLWPQPNLDVRVTGDLAWYHDSELVAMEGMKKAERYTFPLVAIALILVFGSLIAAGVPLVVGGASILLTMALVFVLGQCIDITTSSLTVISFVGLGLGVDFALIIISRFREEVKLGKSTEESLATTIATSGKAIFYSALTSVIGMGAMISFEPTVLRSLGIGGVVVVLLALSAGLTLVPALLGVLGPRINRLALFHLPEGKGVFWQRLAGWEMRHPLVVLALILPFLGILVWSLAGINPSQPSYVMLPEHAEARQGYDTLGESFCPGELGPVMVAVKTDDDITGWHSVSHLYDYTRTIAEHEEVVRVESIVDLDPSITREQYQLMYADPENIPDPRIQYALDQLTGEETTLVRVYGRHDPLGPETLAMVNDIRAMDSAGLQTYVTGTAAMHKDMVDQMYSHFIWVLLGIMATSYLAMLCLLKSVFLPLKAVVLNVASVGATFGILVYIFQEGHFSGVLGFTADGTTTLMAIVMVFCVVFGMSMDYEVYLLGRVKEAWEETKDNTASVGLGLARTGRVITSAAFIMVVVFGTFSMGDFVVTKLVGLGLALAILLDATVIRAFLAPALMRVMGKWNWWAPAFLERLWTPSEQQPEERREPTGTPAGAPAWPGAGLDRARQHVYGTEGRMGVLGSVSSTEGSRHAISPVARYSLRGRFQARHESPPPR
jgi:RND superfamily putative drug exporter